MIDFLTLHKFFYFSINIFAISLGIWVYFSNKKSRINQIYATLAFIGSFWVIFSFFYRSQLFPKLILLWARLNWGLIVPFLLFGYFFSYFFPFEGKKKYPVLNKIVTLLAIVLFLITTTTGFIVKKINVLGENTYVVLGEGANLFYFITTLFVFLIIYFLFKRYFQLSPTEKLKTQYFLIGVFIFALFNIVFNIILPGVWKITTYDFIGDYSIIFLLGFTAYAIVKRELFGIRVVLTQILVGVIAIVLLVQALGSETIFEYIWKGAVFLVFLFFGFLLIRSVMREIKLREALQQAYAKLQVLDKAKSEFISIASHQLRTPLTAIKGYISMILEGSYGEMPEKAQRPVENVYKSAERLINLVNDLLSVSRLEAGKIKVEPKKVCIEELILGIIEELKIKANEKKIYLKFQQPLNPLPKVIIDPDKIRQVILNIIDNAIRYTITGGITVEAEVEAGKLRVIIADTGEGMTREERSHLFESFSRGAAGGRLWTEGSGLGLYVARRFVEMHQGKVWVESEGKGKGSTFFIELPRKFGNNENFDKFMKAV